MISNPTLITFFCSVAGQEVNSRFGTPFAPIFALLLTWPATINILDFTGGPSPLRPLATRAGPVDRPAARLPGRPQGSRHPLAATLLPAKCLRPSRPDGQATTTHRSPGRRLISIRADTRPRRLVPAPLSAKPCALAYPVGRSKAAQYRQAGACRGPYCLFCPMLQKLIVAAPRLINSCITLAPVITTPSRRFS